MNVEVPNKIFRAFFDLIWKKFSKEALSIQKIPCTKKEEIWKTRCSDSGKFLTQKLFGVNWDYFRKRHSESKKEIGSVLINPNCFSKAINYLGIFPEKDNSLKEAISEEQHALHLLDRLTKYVQDNFDDTQSADITDLSRLPEFRICSKVCNQFFDFINSNKYLDAWELLSPSCKAEMFGEKFSRFQNRFIHFQSFTKITFHDLWISHRKVDFNIIYSENRFIFDLKEILLLSRNKGVEGSVYAQAIIKPIENWLLSAGFKNLEKLSKKSIEDFKFQQLILSVVPKSFMLKELGIIPEEISEPSLKNFVFVYLESRWLIEQMSGFETTFYNFSDNYLI